MDGDEVVLPSWQHFGDEDPLTKRAVECARASLLMEKHAVSAMALTVAFGKRTG